MSSIDNRIVQMQFNNKQFESGAKQTLGTLEKLKKTLDFSGVKTGIDTISKSIQNGLKLDSVISGVEALNQKFSSLGVAWQEVVRKITDKAISMGETIRKSLSTDAIIDGLDEYTLKMDNIQTILTNTASKGTTLDDVNDALNQLNKYADDTVYSFQDMTRAIGQFTTQGVDLETAVGAIKGFSNLAAGTGTSNTDLARAEYQMSQALSSGVVKLMDWKSMENAGGMGGEYFQKGLIESAKELGKELPEGLEDGLLSFRDSVSDLTSSNPDWLTSDVLLHTLNKFAEDPTLKAAATEVKTFNQLIDTLKEALGTGWADSWEVIIGNFEEAKKLWTAVSNTLGDLINNAANARLELLKGWKEAGGRDILIQALADAYKALLSVIEPVSKAMDEIFPKITTDRLVDLTKNFGSFTKSLKLNEHQSSILYTATKNIGSAFKQITAVIQAMASAFGSVFNNSFRTTLFSIVEIIGKLAEKVKFSTATIGKIYSIAKGFFSLISIGITVIKSLFNALSPLFSNAGGVVTTLLNNLSDFALKIVAFDTYLKKTQIIQTGLEKLIGKLKNVSSSLLGLYDTIIKTGKNVFDNIKKYGGSAIISYLIKMAEKALTIFNNVHFAFTNITKSIFSSIRNSLSNSIDFSTTSKSVDALTEAFGNLKNAISSNLGPMSVFSSIWNVVKNVFSFIGSLLDDIGSKIGKAFSNLSLSDFKDFTSILIALAGAKSLKDLSVTFKTFGTSVNHIAQAISGGISQLTSELTPITTLTNTFKGFFDSLSSSIEGFEKAVKIQSLKAIAVSVAILAASLLVLSLINVDRLWPALGALTALITEVSSAMIGLTRLSGDMGAKQVAAISGSMIAMSLAVLVLSAALKVLSSIDSSTLDHSSMILTGLIAALVGVSRTLSTDTKGMISGAMALILFAKAIKTLSKAFVVISDIPADSLGRSLLALLSIMAGLTAVMRFGKFDSLGIKSAIGIVLFAKAIKILGDTVVTLGQYDLVTIAKGLLGMGTSMLLLTGAMIAISKFAGDSKFMSIGISMILIAEAIKILAGSVTLLGNLSIEELVKGLLSVIVIMGAMVGSIIALEKLGGEGRLVSAALAMILMATSLRIVSGAVSSLSELGIASLAKGLIAFVVVLGSMTGAMIALSKLANSGSLVLISVSMAIMAAALRSLSKVVKDLSKLKLKELAIGLGGLAGMLAITVGALVLLSKLANPASLIATAAALVVAATAINILAVAMKVLSTLGVSGLIISLIALAGAFVVIGAAAIVLGPLVPVILALGVAIAALGIGLLAAAASMVLFVSAITAFAALGATAGQVIKDFVGYLSEVIPEIAEAIANGILSFVEVMADNTGELVRMAIQMLIEVLTAIRDNIYQVVQLAADIIINFLDGLASKLPDLVDSAANLIVTFINSIADAVDEHGDEFLDAIWKLFLSLGKLELKIIKKGKELLEKLWEGIKSIPLVDRVLEFVEDAFNGIKDLWDTVKEVGEDLIDGLWNGIKDAAEGLIEDVKSIGEDVIDGFKDVLGIHSPSKEMAKIGSYTMQGLSLGIETEGKKSEKLAETYASGIYGIFDNAYKSGFKTPYTGINAYRPSVDLSEIVSGKSAISSFLSGDISPSTRLRTMCGLDISGQLSDLDLGSSEIVDSIHELQNEVQSMSETIGNMQIVMDTGAVVGQIATPLDYEYGRRTVYASRRN